MPCSLVILMQQVKLRTNGIFGVKVLKYLMNLLGWCVMSVMMLDEFMVSVSVRLLST